MKRKLLQIIIFIFALLIAIALLYLITLFFPQPFYKYKYSFEEITIYSDEPIDNTAAKDILILVDNKIQKSIFYRPETKHNIFITNNIYRWNYFTNINNNAGGLNYVIFNHNIFLRKSDIVLNRLYSPSGMLVSGDRTLDYFIAHEITHTMEFESMPFYQYPIQTNWVLEGYAEYIAHNSESYEKSLDTYLNVPETSGAKYYTRCRTMVAYMLEKKSINIADTWSEVNNYDNILSEAIPNNSPKIVESYDW